MERSGLKMIARFAVGVSGCHGMNHKASEAMRRFLENSNDKSLANFLAANLPSQIREGCTLAGVVLGEWHLFLRLKCAELYWTGSCQKYNGQPVTPMHLVRLPRYLSFNSVERLSILAGLPPFHNCLVLLENLPLLHALCSCNVHDDIDSRMQLRAIRNCMVRAGMVLEVKNGRAQVRCENVLGIRLENVVTEVEIADTRTELVSEVRQGDWVAIHGRHIRQVITPSKAERIDMLTIRAIKKVEQEFWKADGCAVGIELAI